MYRAKNLPIFLRNAFPRDATGDKTGDGALSASISFPVGEGVITGTGSDWNGSGTLAASASIVTSAGRNFYDLGTGDTLLAGVTIAASPSPGVGWVGDGTLAGQVSLTTVAAIVRYAAVTLQTTSTINGTGDLGSPGDATGNGTLAAGASITSSAKRGYPAVGALSGAATLSAMGVLVKPSNGVLAASVTISGNGSSSVSWTKLAEVDTTWTILPKTRSST